MALRNIMNANEPRLHKKSRAVTEYNDRLHQLIDDMRETLMVAEGVGLAAPQVGILRRVAVIDVGDGPIELINPVITSVKGKQREVEGCLSSPGQWGYVVRPAKVKVTAMNRYGKEFKIEGTELLARALCHEIDHLNGVVFTDLADEMVEPEA